LSGVVVVVDVKRQFEVKACEPMTDCTMVASQCGPR